MDVAGLFGKRVGELGEKTAVVCRDRKATFKELRERVARLIGLLRAKGLEKGGRLAVMLPNTFEWVELYLAAYCSGVIIVPIDVRMKGPGLAAVLDKASPGFLVTLPPFLEAVKGCGAPVPETLFIGEGYEEALAEAEAAEFSTQEDGEDAVYFHTSGTTGLPKVVVLTYGNLDWAVPKMRDSVNLSGDDAPIILLPFTHIGGGLSAQFLAELGSKVVIQADMNPVSVWEAVAREKVTCAWGVPPIFAALLRAPNVREADTSSLRWIAMMGMTVPPDLMRAFKGALPHVTVIQGYGLTETSPFITIQPLGSAEKKLGSIGPAVSGADVRLVDEDGKDVPDGEVGEMITRGPHLMKGYLDDPEATGERIRDGWLYTGDLAKRDPDGFYYHMGRSDDLLQVGGLKVYPSEVELVLRIHPAVADCVAWGEEDERRGQRVAAAVVLEKGAEFAEAEMLKFCRERLPDYKCPRRIRAIDKVERTGTGKTRRPGS